MGIVSSARWKLQQAWRRGPIRLPTRGTSDNTYALNSNSSYSTTDGSRRKSSASLLATILLIAVGIFWALHGDGRQHERVGFHRGLPGFSGPVKVLSADVVPCLGPGSGHLGDSSLEVEGRRFDERRS